MVLGVGQAVEWLAEETAVLLQTLTQRHVVHYTLYMALSGFLELENQRLAAKIMARREVLTN
jgi:hypothetical protein